MIVFLEKDKFVDFVLMCLVILFALTSSSAISSEIQDSPVKAIETALVYKILSNNSQDSLFNKNHAVGGDLRSNELYLILNSRLLGIDNTVMIKYNKNNYNTIDLNILKLSKHFDLNNRTSLLLGRDIVNWDVGYGSSILSFFDFKETDDKTIENYSMDKKGVNLIKLSYYGGNYNVDFVYGDDTSNSVDGLGSGRKQVALRASTQLDKYSISAILQKYEHLDSGYGASISSVYGDNIKLYSSIFMHHGSQRLIHESISTGILQYYNEDPYSRIHENNGIWYPHLTIGLDYTTENFWNYAVEYIYDKRGLSRAEWRNFLDLINYHSNNTIGLPQTIVNSNLKYDAKSLLKQGSRQKYIFIRSAKTWDNIESSLSTLFGLSDRSASIALQTKYTYNDSMDSLLEIRSNVGPANSEFGESIDKTKISFYTRFFF